MTGPSFESLKRPIVLLVCLFILSQANPLLAADPPVVHNGATPANERQVLRLVEKWRITADDDLLLGVVNRVIRGPGGDLYLLDNQLSQVQVLDRDGHYLKTLGRPGEGPGEVSNPNDMIVLPDGSVGLVRNYPGSVILVQPDGSPGGQIELGDRNAEDGGFFVTVRARLAGSRLIVGGAQMQVDGALQKRDYFLRSYDLEGRDQALFWTRSAPLDYSDFVIVRRSNGSSS